VGGEPLGDSRETEALE